MNVARPPGGFNVVVRPNVQAFVNELCAHHPELPRHWKAVIERLKEAGHKAGEPVDGDASQRTAIFQPFYKGPNIWLAWRVLGDTITVLLADL